MNRSRPCEVDGPECVYQDSFRGLDVRWFEASGGSSLSVAWALFRLFYVL